MFLSGMHFQFRCYLKAAELFYRLLYRLKFYDDGIHRVLLEVHLPGQGQNFRRASARHDSHPITVSNNNVSRIYQNTIAMNWNLATCKAVVVNGRGRNNSSCIDW